jgi:uncharacterized protein (TIGR03435 family)
VLRYKRFIKNGSLAFLLAACFDSSVSFSQSTVPPLTFDIASVKRIAVSPGADRVGMKREITPIGVMMRGVSLGHCIRWAYDVQPYEVVGPDWLDFVTDALYDIDAKAGEPVSEPQLKLMLRTLLVERFRLTLHREKRELPAFALVVAKNGVKIRRAAVEGEVKTETHGPFSTCFKSMSMANYVQGTLVPPWVSRPVVDRTGLQGVFDFTLDLGRYILNGATGRPILDETGKVDMEGALLRGLPEQLGLSLQSTRAPFEVLVIDHLEKDPTGN